MCVHVHVCTCACVLCVYVCVCVSCDFIYMNYKTEKQLQKTSYYSEYRWKQEGTFCSSRNIHYFMLQAFTCVKYH